MAKREFKGIWIPKAIWLDKNLNVTEKLLYAEIDSYDNDFGCVATNKTLCEDLQITASTASGVIKSLEKKGYLEIVYKDYNTFEGRTIKVLDTPLAKSGGALAKSEPPLAKSEPSNTFSNTYSNLNINTDSKESVKKPLTIYQQLIEFWLKDFHPSFTFEAVHGVKIKSLITKIKKLLKSGSFEISDETILKTFKAMCLNLPEYYKDKDLSVIDSKFNEITTEIIKNKNGTKSSNQQSKPIERYSPFATRS